MIITSLIRSGGIAIESEDRNQVEESDWNAADATLKRIDEIKKFIVISNVNEDVETNFKYLKQFWKELNPMLSKTRKIDIEKPDGEKVKLTEKESQKLNYQLIKDLISNSKSKDSEISKDDIIDKLDEWELELRDLEQEHKMNIPTGRDARFAMSGR